MRRRITVLVALISTALLVSFLVPLALLVRTLAEDRGMAAADQTARNVAILVSGISDPAQLASLVEVAVATSGLAAGVISPAGERLGTIDGLDAAEVDRARAGEAFSIIDADGGRVYVPIALNTGTSVVVARVPVEDLYAGVAEAWWTIGGTGIALLAVSLLIAAQASRRISEPLLEVAATAHRLRDGDLAARADEIGPSETREVAAALNGLAERISGLLVEARADVGELAHRLRTPVTALRLDLDAVGDAELAGRLQDRVVALQRAIDVIVKEARREVREDLPEGCDLAQVVRERVEYWRALAEDQGRSVQVELPSTAAPVELSRLDAEDVVDILIDNVFAHTGDSVDFGVSVWQSQREVHLRVYDRGPGFAAAEARRIGSTGLGLDIARRTLATRGGQLLTSGIGQPGASVEVRLPRELQPPPG
ncbi:MAG: HAMP domain-containing histidine kinase [Propionibacteriaceae bacterium]|nr:HAMP domain-containing histidine kinase [Propionibacteriaceae bacterium]